MRLLDICLASLLMVGIAAAGAHENLDANLAANFDEQLTAEINTFLQDYAKVYERKDFEKRLTMWDRDFEHPIYIAEQIDPPIYGWEGIRAYFNPRPGVDMLDGLRVRYTDVRANYLTHDIALATYNLHFDLKVKGQEAMSSWDRVLSVFRRSGEEWKLVVYAEAPMAPSTMVRRMLQNQVPDDFDSYLAEQD